jgi:hypothetical protein
MRWPIVFWALLACGNGRLPDSEVPPARGPTFEWEYICPQYTGSALTKEDHAANLSYVANRYGKQGWEMVGFNDWHVCFKRLVVGSGPQE